MPELDEYNQLLVTNPFSDDRVSEDHDTLSLDSFCNHHPLRSQSGIPSVTLIDNRCETRPSLTHLLTLDGLPAEEAAEDAASEASQDGSGSDIIIHTVGPNDSFASVALRYGISIAALRRANQLWPSDPIHLRTELFIPRGDTLPPRYKSTRNASVDTTIEPTPGSPPRLGVSSFVAARNIILSVLSARISLDSLSSKASLSEDHELDDFRSVRVLPAFDPLFAQDGHELSILTPHKRPAVPLSSCPTHNNQYPDVSHIPPVSDLHPRTITSSRTVSVERLSRMQPFVVMPVRTSQLEPEPAMELPVRLPACNGNCP